MLFRYIISAIDRETGERRELFSVFASSVEIAAAKGDLALSPRWRARMMPQSLLAMLAPGHGP